MDFDFNTAWDIIKNVFIIPVGGFAVLSYRVISNLQGRVLKLEQQQSEMEKELLKEMNSMRVNMLENYPTKQDFRDMESRIMAAITGKRK